MVVTNVEEYIVELPEDASFEDYFESQEVPQFNQEFQEFTDVTEAPEAKPSLTIIENQKPKVYQHNNDVEESLAENRRPIQVSDASIELIELIDDDVDDIHEQLRSDLENLEHDVPNQKISDREVTEEEFSNFEFEAFSRSKTENAVVSEKSKQSSSGYKKFEHLNDLMKGIFQLQKLWTQVSRL